jgi:hypothetical protein
MTPAHRGPRRSALARIRDPRHHGAMAGPIRRRPGARLALAIVLAVVSFGMLGASSATPSADALSRWRGGVDLYRSGVFTTQKTWLWCTAADVQIMRNIVTGGSDHSKASQQRYFDYMRAHNRYRIPLKDGVDPGGWAAGLRRYVDRRYRIVASGSFDAALRSAVTNLRKTNRPVGITVAHGNHAWVLTGFTATADPAKTTRFTVTSVRVTGPLWGLQSRSYGYDMAPDRKLTPSQLRGFFTPWHYAGVRMAWEGKWVSIQPVATSAASAPTPTPTPTPTPKATPRPVARATPQATPKPRASPSPSASHAPSVAPSASAEAIAPVAAIATTGPADPASSEPLAFSLPARPAAISWPSWLVLSLLGAAGLVLFGLYTTRRARP